MDRIGEVTLKTMTLLGREISYAPAMLHMTWLVMGLLLVFGLLTTRRLRLVPGRLQSSVELVFLFLRDIIYATLGEKDGKHFTPFIIGIFLFTLLSNWIGIVPNLMQAAGAFFALGHKLIGGPVELAMNGLTDIRLSTSPDTWYAFLFHMEGFEEPTKFLSTDIALALTVFLVVHGNAIRAKGIGGYFKSYMEPLPAHAPWIFFFFLNPFFYTNIISQLGNTISHCFRLFGNIFGGSIIILIVSTLLNYLVLPIGLHAFFGLFAGLIQAFVFTMLAVTYIGLAK